MDFTGKVAVVTGGTNGIGRALTEALLGAGTFVACMDTDKDAGERLTSRYGDRLLFFAGDAAEENDLKAFSEAVFFKHTGIDFLVNNACVSKHGLLSGCSFEDFTYVLRLGVTGPYYLSLLFRDVFRENAAIVNIASSRAFQSQMDTESYTAAKGGILSLTHALAMSLSGRVRVNAICPGWIDTTAFHGEGGEPSVFSEPDMLQHPVSRVGNPQDIVEATMFLLSDRASFITGTSLTVDGGMTRRMIYHGDEGWSYQA